MLIKNGGEERIEIDSKVDNILVEKGDQLLFVTGGSGGWGDPLERDPEKVRVDVVRDLVSIEKAKDSYGVVIDARTFEVQIEETNALRSEQRNLRGPLAGFNFGNRDEVVANRKV